MADDQRSPFGSLAGWSPMDLLNAFFNEALTPLTSTKAFAELMLHGAAGPLTPQQQECVQQISANIDHVLMVRTALFEECNRRAREQF
jgi:hypothetical protein